MKNEVLNDELKTRVPKQYKKILREVAISRHLKLSDILREAIREKIDRTPAKKKRDGKLALRNWDEMIQQRGAGQ